LNPERPHQSETALSGETPDEVGASHLAERLSALEAEVAELRENDQVEPTGWLNVASGTDCWQCLSLA
jgi:hypothetical protein